MDGWWDRRQGAGGDRDEGHQAASGSSKSSLPVFRHLPTFKHALFWLFLLAHPSPQTIIVDTPAIVGPFDDASSLLALCLEVLPHQSFRNYNCCIFPSMTQADVQLLPPAVCLQNKIFKIFCVYTMQWSNGLIYCPRKSVTCSLGSAGTVVFPTCHGSPQSFALQCKKLWLLLFDDFDLQCCKPVGEGGGHPCRHCGLILCRSTVLPLVIVSEEMMMVVVVEKVMMMKHNAVL